VSGDSDGSSPAAKGLRGPAGFRRPAPGDFRWPAEWEPHRATWLAWPHNPETWPGALREADAVFGDIAAALAQSEALEILVPDAEVEERARAQLQRAGAPVARIRFHPVPTDDSWIRDTGPIFLTGASGLAAVDFRFDAWGGKYPPWERDDAVGAEVARRAGAELFSASFVLEGGSIDGDGEGTLLTTESCLLEARKEPERDRGMMEERLAAYLGASQVIWLTGEVVGDDTDGHVDDLARFVAPGLVVAGREANPKDPNHGPLEENLSRLARARDARGRPLEIVELPMPSPVLVNGERCPASYLNFYVANQRVLVPTFDVPEDARALAILSELFDGREIAAIPARTLVMGFGAIHCLTQQEPLVGSPDRDPGVPCISASDRGSA
jgi:agmatine deiminase